jgi:hypothetical protein
MHHARAVAQGPFGDMPRSLHVNCPLLAKLAPSNVHLRGAVHHSRCAGNRAINGSRVANIAPDGFDRQIGQGLQIRSLSHQNPDRFAALDQQSDRIVANKASGPGN